MKLASVRWRSSRRLLVFGAIGFFLMGQALGPFHTVFAAEPISNVTPEANNNSTTTPIPNDPGSNAATVAAVNAELTGVVTSLNTWINAPANNAAYADLNTIYRTIKNHTGHFSTAVTLADTANGFNNKQSEILGAMYDLDRVALPVNNVTKLISIGGFSWKLSSMNRSGQQIFRTPGVTNNLAVLAEGVSGLPTALYLYNYSNQSMTTIGTDIQPGGVAAAMADLNMAVGANINLGYQITPGIGALSVGSWALRALSTDINETGAYTGLRTSDFFDDSFESVLPQSVLNSAPNMTHASLDALRTFFYGVDQIPMGAPGDDAGNPGTWELGFTNGPGPQALLGGTGYGNSFWTIDYLFGHFNRVLNTKAFSLLGLNSNLAWGSNQQAPTIADEITSNGSTKQINWRIRAINPTTGNKVYNFLVAPNATQQVPVLRSNVGIEKDANGDIVKIYDLNYAVGDPQREESFASQTEYIQKLQQKIFNEFDSVGNNPFQPGFNAPGPGDPNAPFFGIGPGLGDAGPGSDGFGEGGDFSFNPGGMYGDMNGGFFGPSADGSFGFFEGGFFGPGPGEGLMGPGIGFMAMGPNAGMMSFGNPGSFFDGGPSLAFGFNGPMDMGSGMMAGQMNFTFNAGSFMQGPDAGGFTGTIDFGPMGPNLGSLAGFGPGFEGAGAAFAAAFDSALAGGPMNYADMMGAITGPGANADSMAASFGTFMGTMMSGMSGMMGNAGSNAGPGGTWGGAGAGGLGWLAPNGQTSAPGVADALGGLDANGNPANPDQNTMPATSDMDNTGPTDSDDSGPSDDGGETPTGDDAFSDSDSTTGTEGEGASPE